MRRTFIAFWSSLLVFLLLFGHASASEGQFASEELNLLNAEESAILTQQAQLVAQSIAIKAHPVKTEIQKLRIYLNSGMMLTNFPMDKSLQDVYIAKTSAYMARNHHIRYVTKLADKPQGAILTALSVVPTATDQAVVEVTIAAFDWDKATALKEGMPGVIKSVVWFSVGRQVVPLATADIKNLGAEPIIRNAYSALLKSAFSAFLLAF